MNDCKHPPTDKCGNCWCDRCDDWIVNVGSGPKYTSDEHWREHEDDEREREEDRALMRGDW